jgi:shikimate kinase
MKPIFLVGFMGTGKSSVAKRLAAVLSIPYVDMDAAIEERAGRKIADIFAKDGEPAFRALERDMLLELSAKTDLVVSCGGGVVIDPANRATMREQGLAVCLDATAETVYERIRHETHRPLLRVADPLQEIKILMLKREPFYQDILHHVSTDRQPVDAVVMHICSLLKECRHG